MNVHVFACTSCHAFMPKQISFPISLFSNSFSDSENLALILHNIYTHFFSIRTLLNVLSFFSLLSSSLFPQTQHTPLPPSMWHPLLTLPLQLPMQPLSPNTPPSPHPPPKMLLSLSRMERDRKVGREEDHWAFSLMDLRIFQMFSTTRMHLCLMNKSFFSLHLLSFTLSALPTSLQGCISVQLKTELIWEYSRSQLGIKLLP